MNAKEGKPSTRRRWLWFIAAVIVVGLIVQVKYTAHSPVEAQRDLAVERAAAGAARLRDSMRNPGRFQLSQVHAMENGAICYVYRGENGFGGLNVETALLDLNLSLRPEQSAGFIPLWNHSCVGNSRDITAPTATLLAALRR